MVYLAAIINNILNVTVPVDTNMAFYEPDMDISLKAGAYVGIGLFLVLIAVSLKEVVFGFFKNCKKEAGKEDEDLYGKYSVQFG